MKRFWEERDLHKYNLEEDKLDLTKLWKSLKRSEQGAKERIKIVDKWLEKNRQKEWKFLRKHEKKALRLETELKQINWKKHLLQGLIDDENVISVKSWSPKIASKLTRIISKDWTAKKLATILSTSKLDLSKHLDCSLASLAS